MTAQEIANRLAEFESADEIAATLAVLGIKGTHGSPRKCPLARACRTQIGYWALGRGFKVRTPDAASTFVARFDSSEYPELEAN